MTRVPAYAALTAGRRLAPFSVDTVSAAHDYGRLLGLLRPFGAMAVVGVPPTPTALHALSLIGGNQRLAATLLQGS